MRIISTPKLTADNLVEDVIRILEAGFMFALTRRHTVSRAHWSQRLNTHQMPCQGDRDRCVADSGTNEPYDDHHLEFLEVHEFRDEVNRDGGSDASDCSLKSVDNF